MQSKVKLTKRQIKEDKFTTFMLNAKHRFQDNWQYYAAGVLVVILIAAAVSWYVSDQESHQAEAEAKFSRAVLDYQSGDNQVALLGFDQLLTDYSNTDVARQATYLLGNIHLSNKNYQDAIHYFEIYLERYKDDKLNRAAAQAGIATAEEDQGNYDEAAQAYVKAAEMLPDGPLVADYQLGALRNYLKVGNMEAAKKRYDIVAEKYANTDPGRIAIRLYAEQGNS